MMWRRRGPHPLSCSGVRETRAGLKVYTVTGTVYPARPYINWPTPRMDDGRRVCILRIVAAKMVRIELQSLESR